MNSKNGWILPDGRYVECEHEHHALCAKEEFGMNEEELEKTAVKVTNPSSIDTGPDFLTLRREMTQEQLRTIEKYCLHFRCRPPMKYFYQQDLMDMARMSTADILTVMEQV